MFDGRPSSSGLITHFIKLPLIFRNDLAPLITTFYVTTLAGADLVLGDDWLAKQQAVLEHAQRRIHITLPSSTSSRPFSSSSTSATSSNVIKIESPSRWGSSSSISGQPANSSANTTSINQSPSLSLDPSINNDALLRAISVDIMPNDLLDLDDLKSLGPQFSEVLTPEEFEAETAELLQTLPPQFHDYIDIFRPSSGTKTLPPHRQYDMTIDLVPDAKLSSPPLYQLTEEQRKALLDTLERETAAGRIRPSKSSYGAPMFFVPKKDGKFRMVVDYRQVNRVTQPDAYPLPLISQIISDLSKAKFFTKLDLVGAYQLLRISPGHEPLTAFRTQYGMYESLVVRDGLRNAPAAFQHFLNEVFRELLGKGVTIYIDDILIYAASQEELHRLTIQVFDRVRSASLYLKANKCEFAQTSLLFLGFQVSHQGVSTNPEKIKAIKEFPCPRTLKESRSFIGLVGYYRRFVKGFSEIAAPITALTKKNQAFIWGDAQQRAFETLKEQLISAPTLAHYNPSYPTILQTDASFFGWGFVISQVNPTTHLEHPVAIESGRFTGAQLNYPTNEKEFLAIVEAFVRCRHMLLQVHTTVLTDHHNLSHWMKPRQLSPRQARWVELLSPFRFDIIYRPGKQASMPDALSRRSDYHPGKGTTMDQEHNFVQALPGFSVHSAESSGSLDHSNEFSNLSNSSVECHPGSNSSVTSLPNSSFSPVSAILRALIPTPSVERNFFVTDSDILDGLRVDLEISPVFNGMLAMICTDCSHPSCHSYSIIPSALLKLRQSSRNPYLHEPSFNSQGFLSFGHRIYVPNYNNARHKILEARHNSPLAGHPGITKSMELISRDYIWNGLRKDVEAYVAGCVTCQRTKVSHQRSHPLLKPLPVPKVPWRHLSMDFIEPLPNSGSFNSILVIVDRLTKWAIFIPTTTRLTAPGLAELVLSHVLPQHGLPDSIVSDRGTKFVSKFWRHLTDRLGIKLNLSTAYHPQTDGQTERVNQVLEQYLRIFTSYHQDDWDLLLPQASFHYNNSFHSATHLTPFFANFGYHPRWIQEIQSTSTSTDVPDAIQVAVSLLDLHKFCTDNITIANERYAATFNRKHTPGPSFEVGDQVLLSMENIKTIRPTKKLDIRNSGPFRVRAKISDHAYQIDIPPNWRIFDIFHVSLLRPFTPPFSNSQIPALSPPIELSEDVSLPVYQVANILNSRNNSSTGKLEYLVEWAGREGTNEQVSWQLPSDLDHATIAIAEFHERYPSKPSSDTTPSRSRRPPGRHRKKHRQAPPSSDPQLSTSSSSQLPSPPISTSPPHTSSSIPQPISHAPSPVHTSSRPTNIPFRPKQPANWKGWALVPDLPPITDPTPIGPTSRSGRPLKSKNHFE